MLMIVGDHAEKCIFTPIFSICFFRLFASLKIGSNAFINKIASTTFGVYLIHGSFLGKEIHTVRSDLQNCTLSQSILDALVVNT